MAYYAPEGGSNNIDEKWHDHREAEDMHAVFHAAGCALMGVRREDPRFIYGARYLSRMWELNDRSVEAGARVTYVQLSSEIYTALDDQYGHPHCLQPGQDPEVAGQVIEAIKFVDRLVTQHL